MSNAKRKPARGGGALARRAAEREARNAHLRPGTRQLREQLDRSLDGDDDKPRGGKTPAGVVAIEVGAGGPPGGSPSQLAERRTAAPEADPSMGPAKSVSSPPASSVMEEVAAGDAVLDEVPGRPRKRSTLSSRLKRALSMDGGRHADELAWALVERAKGTSKVANDALRIILDRVEGPVVKKLETKGEMHHRKTIVVKASEELLARAGDDARLVDVDLPADPVPDGEVLGLPEEAGE